MMTRNGLLIERVCLCEGSIQETHVTAREIVRVETGSVYSLEDGFGGSVLGYLKLIIVGDHVKAYAQKSRTSGRRFLGTDLDFSDAVDYALGAM